MQYSVIHIYTFDTQCHQTYVKSIIVTVKSRANRRVLTLHVIICDVAVVLVIDNW